MSPLILTLLVGLFILGGIIIGLFTTKNKSFVDFSIGGAFGVIISLVIFELIPHAYHHIGLSSNLRTILLLIIVAAIGFFIMNMLDKFIPHHEHEEKHQHHHKDDKCHDEHLGHIGILATVALFIHNIIEGMTLYATASSSMNTGYLLCLGIGLHNIPIGIVVANTVKNKRKSIISAIILVLSSFLGGLMMLLIDPVSEFIIGVLLALTTGMMLYLTIVELFPQIKHSKHKLSAILGVLLGFILLIISFQLGGHHH